MIVSLIYGLSGLPASAIGLYISIPLLLYFIVWLFLALSFIDMHIAAAVGLTRGWPVHAKSYSLYKFVDLHRAAQQYVATQPSCVEVRSEHSFALSGILNGLPRTFDRRLNTATMNSHRIGYDQQIYVSCDTFWLIPTRKGAIHSAAVIRLRINHHTNMVALEVAAPHAAEAAAMLAMLVEHAAKHSIYRNQLIRTVFGAELPNHYSDDEYIVPIDLVFYKETPINEDDIILDEMHRGIIERTLVDFHRRREQLAQLGLPNKRGVLFYGPPGTGKTYTCKYIAQRLESVTTIVVTGQALLHIKEICAIAKMLQPALVLLEDVDLVFAHRETNAYNTVLGEFIDQLDGFGDTDQIIFILTTNALDRLESALKDRPGRISQCIYFGPPSAALRLRYLERLVQDYDVTSLNVSRVVNQTEGASQAFLKELVFRAVQIASVSSTQCSREVHLNDTHFATALRDMTQGSGQAAYKLIGFRMDGER